MKMRKLAALVAMNLVIALQVVNSQNTLYNYFPEKIKVLVAFKPLEIGSKIPVEVFNESILAKSAENEKDEELLGILKNIKTIGINLDQAFLLVSEGFGSDSKVTHLLAKLEDPSAFKKFLLDKAKLEPAMIRTYGTDNVFFPDEETVVAFNNKVVIIASEKGNYDVTDISSDTLIVEDYQKWYENNKENKQRGLRNLAFELLTPRPGNAFVLDPKFQALMNEPGEIKIWNEDKEELPLGGIIPAPHFLHQLSRLSTGLKTIAIEFAPGKIIARTRNYPAEEMAALIAKNPPAPAGEEFFDLIPEGKILAFLNGSLSNKMIRELLAKPAFEELSDSLKQYTSFDIQQLPSIFGDKMMGAVVYNKGVEPEIDLVVGIPIRDLDGFKKLQSELGRVIDSMKKTDTTDFAKRFRPVVKNNEKMMVLSLSDKTARDFLTKKGVRSLPAHLREYAKYPMMLHLNLPELIRTVMMKETMKFAPEELSFLDKMQDIRVYGGEFREGATLVTAEFNISDPSQNSLVQIFGMINDVMTMLMKNKSESGYDDTTTTVAADTAFNEDKYSLLRAFLPELNDAKAQKFLEDYTEVVIAYKESLSDSAEDVEAKTMYLQWQERARVMGKDLTDKEDAKKFNEYILILKKIIDEEDPANKEDN